jgi:ABC-type lipoprotein release transport system permease subunit
LSREHVAPRREDFPDDALTFILVAAVLLFEALAARYIPTQRAMKVDPMVALRYE